MIWALPLLVIITLHVLIDVSFSKTQRFNAITNFDRYIEAHKKPFLKYYFSFGLLVYGLLAIYFYAG